MCIKVLVFFLIVAAIAYGIAFQARGLGKQQPPDNCLVLTAARHRLCSHPVAVHCCSLPAAWRSDCHCPSLSFSCPVCLAAPAWQGILVRGQQLHEGTVLPWCGTENGQCLAKRRIQRKCLACRSGCMPSTFTATPSSRFSSCSMLRSKSEHLLVNYCACKPSSPPGSALFPPAPRVAAQRPRSCLQPLARRKTCPAPR